MNLTWFEDVSAWVIPVVLAITLHEAAHGWMAYKFGDDTAKQKGRVTFNPLKHVHKFGTVIFPGILALMHSPMIFGFAKPVPVNFDRLRPARFGMFMVALAGPGSNIIQAIIAALLLHVERWVTPEQAPWLFQNLYRAVMINCVLVVFNLIPLMPLDGGRMVDALLPPKARVIYGKSERYGVAIVLVCLLIPVMLGSDIAQQALAGPTYWLVEHIMSLTWNSDIGP